MKLFLTVCLIFCATISFAYSEDVKGLIVGGRDATINEYPYMAGVMNFGFLTCTGSIITPRSILTAAHCIIVNIPLTITIFEGSHRRSGHFTRTYGASLLFKHPDYRIVHDLFEIANDIGLVRTNRPIRYSPRVQPIPLNFDFVPGGEEVISTGWGYIFENSEHILPEQLQQLDMITISNSDCLDFYRDFLSVPDNAVTPENLCTVAGPNQSICGGDSGSPIAWNGTVVSVASWTGQPCGSAPSVYVRVSDHKEWLLRHM